MTRALARAGVGPMLLMLVFGASPSAAQAPVPSLRIGPVAPARGDAGTAQAPTPGAPASHAGEPAALPESYPWVRLAERLTPAVVNVRTAGTGSRAPGPPGRALPELPGRSQAGPGEPGRRALLSLGSGFIVDPNGYIATSHHVVDGAEWIEVTLSDGRSLPAKVVGSDRESDLALLHVEATELPTIPLGSSSALRVGEPVMVIGNPFGLDHTVTVGIISGAGRFIGATPYDDFLQTDAAINPGNSGGPLINTRGEVVGIATAIASVSGGFQGIGFAIPVDVARPVLHQLRTDGRVTRGWLGVTAQALTPELADRLGLPDTKGALVTAVAEGSPAERGGLRPGDVIVRYDGRAIATPRMLPALVANTQVGQTVEVDVLREGRLHSLRLAVGNFREAQLSDEGRVDDPAGDK